MAITWKINKIFRSPTYSDKSDVIRILHYTARSEASKGDQHTNFTKRGHAVLDVSSLDNFTSFSNVTEEKALEWLHSALGDEKDKIETELELQSEYSLSPTDISGLPWYTPEEEPSIEE